jgi:hypothetical protein
VRRLLKVQIDDASKPTAFPADGRRSSRHRTIEQNALRAGISIFDVFQVSKGFAAQKVAPRAHAFLRFPRRGSAIHDRVGKIHGFRQAQDDRGMSLHFNLSDLNSCILYNKIRSSAHWVALVAVFKAKKRY